MQKRAKKGERQQQGRYRMVLEAQDDAYVWDSNLKMGARFHKHDNTLHTASHTLQHVRMQDAQWHRTACANLTAEPSHNAPHTNNGGNNGGWCSLMDRLGPGPGYYPVG